MRLCSAALWIGFTQEKRLKRRVKNFMEEKKLTKELRDKYRQAIERVWKDKKMQDFCCKKADIVFPVRDMLAEVEKPTIETRFCFGYGYCGVSSEEDYQDANSMAQHARTSQDYFVRENMKQINGYIEALEDTGMAAYAIGHYREDGIVSIHFCEPWNIEKRKRNAEKANIVFFELTDKERKDIAGYYGIEKQRFQKRLNTYLKRYGLSKVHSWSYLSD